MREKERMRERMRERERENERENERERGKSPNRVATIDKVFFSLFLSHPVQVWMW